MLRAKGRTLPLVEQQHPGPAGRVFSNKTKTTANLNQSSPVYNVLSGLLFVVMHMSEVVARSDRASPPALCHAESPRLESGHPLLVILSVVLNHLPRIVRVRSLNLPMSSPHRSAAANGDGKNNKKGLALFFFERFYVNL